MALGLLLVITAIILLRVKEFKGRKVLATIFMGISLLFILAGIGLKAQKQDVTNLVDDYLYEQVNIASKILECDGTLSEKGSCVLRSCSNQMDSLDRFADRFYKLEN